MTTSKEALEQIIAIPNRDYGSDWAEIDEARAIARKALASLEGDAVERVARIIDPSAWAVMDGYLADTKRKYRGQNVGWPADQFQDKASMEKARAILATGLVPDEAAKDAEIKTLRMALEDATSGITASCVEQEIRADERERCAKVASGLCVLTHDPGVHAFNIAAAIRSGAE